MLQKRVQAETIPAFLRSEGEMGKLIAGFPWAGHPLGPVESWPQSLKTAVSLILNSQHPMWIGWGAEASFLYNDAYLHVLGLAKHPWALGRPASEVWAEIWDTCGPLADKVFRDGEPSFVDDVRLFMNRGDFLEETYYSFSYSPIRDESGGVGGLFCPSTDVTSTIVGARRLRTLSELSANALAQKEVAAACRSAAVTLAKNPDDVPFALLYLTDGDALVLEQNVGFPGAEVHTARWPIAEVLDGERAVRVPLDGMAPLPLGAANVPVKEALVLRVAGRAEVRPFGVLVAGLNPTGRFDAEYAAFFDLVASNIGTAIQNARAAEEEKRRADMLAELDRAKTAFFSNISHEFRTPLTLMLGPLERLTEVEDARIQLDVQTARRNALRLLRLVNTLLEFARLEAGRNDAAFALTDLSALTRDVASSFRSAIEAAGLRFIVELDHCGDVYVDRSMWERVLLNLLSNALKFTFEGEVAVKLQCLSDAVELSVSDTGVGIAQEQLPHLFERFHRVRGTRSRSHEGSGIGLALVRDLVELHGGTVEAESTLGAGTTFRVRIPLGSAHLDPEKIVPTEAAPYVSAIAQYLADVEATVSDGPQPSAIQPASGGRPRAKVLLVDDNADLREYVSSILSPRYDVVTAKNGREALDAARSDRFDLILSDVMMPVMDGFELLQEIRADEKLSTTPFIMLSARAGEESALEGLIRGADEYIAKPFSAEDLLVRVYAQINAASIRESATQAIRASEERFRTLANSLPHIVFEAAPDGTTTYVSEEFHAYTGLSPEQAYGLGWGGAVHPDDVQQTLEKWAHAMRSGEPYWSEFRLRRDDGAYRWFAVQAVAQRGVRGEVLRWTGTATDVHDRRRAAEERDFLAKASQIFAQTLNIDATLDAIAQFTIPAIADWCRIDLKTDDRRIRTVAIAHGDPEKDLVAQKLVGSTHLSATDESAAGYVMRTGQAKLVEDLPQELVGANVEDEAAVQLYREMGAVSYVVVPLIAEGEPLGMLSTVYGPSGRRYTQDDVPLIEELGRRAAAAIYKARLFEREHKAAESFQKASLPKALPEMPTLALDAFYAPGRAEARVGGDWYDALRLLDGRLVVSIGDVAGSGLEAAVTMGNMRQIIRGIAQVHADPALMLDAADRALRLEHPDKFATAFVGVFDPITNTLTYASAGHPSPLLRTPDGRIEALHARGLPLGLRVDGGTSESTTIELRDGSSVVFYTDGLTELNRAPDDGEKRLCEVVSEPGAWDAAEPAKWIVQRMTDGAPAPDDVAVLVVTLCSRASDDARSDDTVQRHAFHTSDREAVSAARVAFAQAVANRGGSFEDIAAAELVFGELVSNTVRYAPGEIEIVVDWSGAEPVLHVMDNGRGFKHIAILPPDVLSESGRGLFIVSALTHDFRVSKRVCGGSHARAVLRLQKRHLVDGAVQAFSGSLISTLESRLVGIND